MIRATVIAASYVIAVMAVVFIGIAGGIWTFAQVARDPSAEYGFPPFGGFVSALGVAGWVISATATGLTAADRPDLRKVLLPICLLSALLACDDQFMLHERVFPHFGIHEKLVLLAYMLFCLKALWPFLPDLLRLKQPLLLIALVAFTLSVLIDARDLFGAEIGPIIEDIAKFTGIVFWTAHWLHFTSQVRRTERT